MVPYLSPMQNARLTKYCLDHVVHIVHTLVRPRLVIIKMDRSGGGIGVLSWIWVDLAGFVNCVRDT